MKLEDVIIIGAGPGGLATALQLKRYGIDPLIFERDRIGGLLNNANLVENYPGFPGGISGLDLVKIFKNHVQVNSLQIVSESVEEISYEEGVFRVKMNARSFDARIVVIATGTKPRNFTDFEIPPDLRELVFYEVYPLLNRQDQRIAIVGAGDAAFDYALNLSQRNYILVLNRGEEISCLPLLWERSQDVSSITYLPNTTISRLESIQGPGLMLDCITNDGPKSIQVDALIGAIGRDPQLDFVSGQFSKKAIQFVNRGDLYYVGDVGKGLYRQTAIAVGDGILAAMKIYQRLKEMDL